MLRNSGSQVLTGSSSEIFPSAARAIIPVATMGFVIDAIRTGASIVKGFFVVGLATPKASRKTTWPRCTIKSEPPGTRDLLTCSSSHDFKVLSSSDDWVVGIWFLGDSARAQLFVIQFDRQTTTTMEKNGQGRKKGRGFVSCVMRRLRTVKRGIHLFDK